MRILREVAAIFGLAVVIGSVCIFWSQLPSQVPTHFDLSGLPNSYGAKSSLWTLPTVTILLYCLLSALSRFPGAFNYPFAVAQEERARLQSLMVELVGWLKAEVMWTFAWLTLTALQVSRGRSHGLNITFAPVTLGVVVITIGLYWKRMLRLKSSPQATITSS